MQVQETFQERLKYCIGQVGTQTAFVSKASVSRSQLSRYLDGESKPSIDRLAEMAEISGVDLAWLVTGEGAPCKSDEACLPFNYDLMQHVIKKFEEELMEYQGPGFTPTQKSILIPFIQAEMEHEKSLGLTDGKLSKIDMQYILDYVSSIKSHELLNTFKNNAVEMIFSSVDLENERKIGGFVNTVCQATSDYFSSPTGESYCLRTKDILNEFARRHLFRAMETLFTNVSAPQINMLDLGCGTGRYMSHIHNTYDRIKVTGLEGSKLLFNTCKELERSGQIPEGSVTMGDARNLPYKDNSFEFVSAIAVLHWLPYFKNSHYGANQVFSEVSRVLKPGGAFYFSSRYSAESGYREYLPFNQVYSKKDIESLARNHGFKLIWSYTINDTEFPELKGIFDVNVPEKYSDFVRVFAIKL